MTFEYLIYILNDLLLYSIFHSKDYYFKILSTIYYLKLMFVYIEVAYVN